VTGEEVRAEGITTHVGVRFWVTGQKGWEGSRSSLKRGRGNVVNAARGAAKVYSFNESASQ